MATLPPHELPSTVAAVLLLLLLVHQGPAEVLGARQTVLMQEWNYFKAQHGKVYGSPVEESFRRRVWQQNIERIAEHNLQYYRANRTFRLAMNVYGDLLHREFLATLTGVRRRGPNFITSGGKGGDASAGSNCSYYGCQLVNISTRTDTSFTTPSHINTTTVNISLSTTNSTIKLPLFSSKPSDPQPPVPQSVDWRARGAVTPVKKQGVCGSCWAFATTGSVEAQHFLHRGQLVSLSEQNLLDCVESDAVEGCLGGNMIDAFIYIRNNGGIDSEENYPYEGEKLQCRYSSSSRAASITGYRALPDGDEAALQSAVGIVGPVAAGIDATQHEFQFYSEGIYGEAACRSELLNHGVLVVGYGTSADGRAYWLVKNSWGAEWGESGYFRLARNEGNMCGIASEASYPLME